ncbi:MAG: glycosyltransferase [Acidimicrobiia bacterium]
MTSDEKRAGPGSITFVISSDRPRGAEVQAERISEGLGRLGWRIELVSLCSQGAGPSVAAEPVSDRAPEGLGRLNRDVVVGLRRRIRARRPDVVLANGSATLRYAVASLVGLRAAGPRLVYVAIGEPTYWIRSRRHRLLQRMLLGRVDLVLAVSEATRRQLVEQMGQDPDRVKLAYSGVPRSFLELTPSAPHQELRLLFLGSLSREKNPEAALEVMVGLGKITEGRLRFVGTGPLQDSLHRRVSELGLGARVEFAGSVRDVRKHLAWADVLVLTSRTEGLPGAAVEAAAAGVPSVAFDVGGTREVVMDGVTGRVLRPGDIEGFVAALLSLAEADETRARWGAAARAMVEDRFLMDHAVASYHRLLLEELQAGRPPP